MTDGIEEFHKEFPKFSWKKELAYNWEAYTGTCGNILIEVHLLNTEWHAYVIINDYAIITKIYDLPLTMQEFASLLRNDFLHEFNLYLSTVNEVLSTVGDCI